MHVYMSQSWIKELRKDAFLLLGLLIFISYRYKAKYKELYLCRFIWKWFV